MTTTELDRAAFLTAIREHPDDDTTRVVFADWLTEHDEAEQGELIRVSVERRNLGNRLPKDMFIEDMDRLNLLRTRARALIAKLSPKCPVCQQNKGWLTHREHGKVSCRHCEGDGYIGSWDRGFLTSVTVPNIKSVLIDATPYEDHPPTWQLTTYFRTELAHHPLLTQIVPADREPIQLDCDQGSVWNWMRNTPEPESPWFLPRIVHDKINLLWPTIEGAVMDAKFALNRERAIDAAALALCEVCRELS